MVFNLNIYVLSGVENIIIFFESTWTTYYTTSREYDQSIWFNP